MSQVEAELFKTFTSSIEWDAIRSLVDYGNIVIKRADKDSCMVIWDRNNYHDNGDNSVTTMASQLLDMTSSLNIFWRLVTGPLVMSISSLVLQLWEFSFIRDWPETRKLEIPPFKFCPISGDWDKLWIRNLAQMSIIECYWMLQNARVTAFTVFKLFLGKPTGGLLPPPHLD